MAFAFLMILWLHFLVLHEYAHAMCFFEEGEEGSGVDDHDTEFGIWYARLYRLMFE